MNETAVKPRFIDLFCGAGGLSLGFEQAGWTPIVAVDAWRDAVTTFSRNFPTVPVRCKDVSKLTKPDLLVTQSSAPTWVIGGPPCQGFSTVGKRLRSDPRNRLFEAFARVVDLVQADGFVAENVLGLRDMQFVEQVIALFPRYRVTVLTVRAADYGVPQLRRRLFFIGSHAGAHFNMPSPTHRESEFVSVWSAIGDLPALGPGERAERYTKMAFTDYQRSMRRGSQALQGHEASKHPQRLVEAISHIPDGGNRQSIPPRLQPKSGFHNSYSRLSSTSPAVAVTQNMGKPSGTRCIHPFQNRGLTAREGARLQGFPDRFHFIGGTQSQRLQVANAVSPILAKVLAKALFNPRHWTLDPRSRTARMQEDLFAVLGD